MHARTVANPVDVAGGSEVRSDNGLIWVLGGWCVGWCMGGPSMYGLPEVDAPQAVTCGQWGRVHAS